MAPASSKHQGGSENLRQLCVSGLHNFQEFSQLPKCLDRSWKHEKSVLLMF